MSEAQELSYDEPWPIFADEDEPWKDLERLLKWEEKMDTQMEMGDAFGCTPSTISYWLQKARKEVTLDHDDEELRCIYFDVCGNLSFSPDPEMCTVCIDLVRHNDRNLGIDPEESEDIETHMEVLFNRYDDFVAERQKRWDEKHSDDSKDSEQES